MNEFSVFVVFSIKGGEDEFAAFKSCRMDIFNVGLIILNGCPWLIWGIHICLVFRHLRTVKCQVGYTGVSSRNYDFDVDVTAVYRSETHNYDNSDMSWTRQDIVAWWAVSLQLAYS